MTSNTFLLNFPVYIINDFSLQKNFLILWKLLFPGKLLNLQNLMTLKRLLNLKKLLNLEDLLILHSCATWDCSVCVDCPTPHHPPPPTCRWGRWWPGGGSSCRKDAYPAAPHQTPPPPAAPVSPAQSPAHQYSSPAGHTLTCTFCNCTHKRLKKWATTLYLIPKHDFPCLPIPWSRRIYWGGTGLPARTCHGSGRSPSAATPPPPWAAWQIWPLSAQSWSCIPLWSPWACSRPSGPPPAWRSRCCHCPQIGDQIFS